MVRSRGAGEEEDNWGAEAEYEKQTPALTHAHTHSQRVLINSLNINGTHRASRTLWQICTNIKHTQHSHSERQREKETACKQAGSGVAKLHMVLFLKNETCKAQNALKLRSFHATFPSPYPSPYHLLIYVSISLFLPLPLSRLSHLFSFKIQRCSPIKSPINHIDLQQCVRVYIVYSSI